MPTYWENDLPPAAGAAPAAPKPQQPQMQQRPQRPAPGGGGGRWWQNPGGGVGSAGPVRPPVGGQPPAPAPAPQPAPAGGAPAPYNAGARFNQPAAPPAAAAPPPAAAAPPAPQQQPAPPPGAVPAGGGYIQPIANEGSASKVWAAQQAAYPSRENDPRGPDPRSDAARAIEQSNYERSRQRYGDDRVYASAGGEDRDPGMSGGGGSSIRAIEPGRGGNPWERAAGAMSDLAGRRSLPMGPPPPAGVASLGVGPVGGDRMAAVSQMENMRAADEQQQQAADQPAPSAPAPEGSIDPGRAAMGLGRGLPPPRRPMMPMRRPMGRGRGPIY